MPEFQCAVASAERGESLVGTASQIRRLLLIEVRGAWGRDALVDSALGPHVSPEWRSGLRRQGIRPLAIRRDLARGAEGDPIHVFFVEVGRGPLAPGRVWHRSLGGLSDVEAMEQPDGPDWSEVTEPLILVCTNGKHDSCCATFGRPLVRHLQTTQFADSVWECSHVGGDRFAANLVHLPSGLFFGRVTPDSVGPLLNGLERGQLDLAAYRGCSTRSFEAQAAEQLVRHDLELTGIDDVVDVVEIGPHRFRVELAEGRSVTAEIDSTTRPSPTPLTCTGSPEVTVRIHSLARP